MKTQTKWLIAGALVAMASMLCGFLAVAAAIGAVTQAAGHEGGNSELVSLDGALAPGHVPATYATLVTTWGRTCTTLTPAILAAQLQSESDWNPRAKSDAGAEGIAQFMPATWHSNGIDANRDGKTDVWDPADAIPSAAEYDCKLATSVHAVPGDATSLMLAAYNAGANAVKKYNGVPPYAETHAYVHKILALAQSYSAQPVAADGAAVTAVNAALAEEGVPYSWGGGGTGGPSHGICCSPGGHSGVNIVGFDCSGLTQYAWGHAGVVLPRTAAQQAGVGKRIPASAGISALQPGDLVFFAYDPAKDSTIYHVGIYLGNGKMINAARPGTNVKTDPVAAMSGYAGGTRLA